MTLLKTIVTTPNDLHCTHFDAPLHALNNSDIKSRLEFLPDPRRHIVCIVPFMPRSALPANCSLALTSALSINAKICSLRSRESAALHYVHVWLRHNYNWL